jgi:hypothetical protein
MIKGLINKLVKRKKTSERNTTSKDKINIIKNVIDQNKEIEKWKINEERVKWQEENNKQWNNLENLNREIKSKTGRDGIWLDKKNIAKNKKNNIV